MPGTGMYPNGISIPFIAASSPSFDPSYPFRGVLHTTQSTEYQPSTTSYYGHNDPPHFTVVREPTGVKTYQHFSINNASRALKNPPGGVETNRGGAIQIEIAWTAEDIVNLPAAMKVALHDLVAWISATRNIQRTAPPFFPESQAVGSGAASRMSFHDWRQYNAWCGHQHVPENVHWDPGPIDIGAIL